MIGSERTTAQGEPLVERCASTPSRGRQACLARRPAPHTVGRVDAGPTGAQYVNIVTCAGRVPGALHGEEGHANANAS